GDVLDGLDPADVDRPVALHAPAHGELGGRDVHPRQVQEIVREVLPRDRADALHGLDAPVAGLALHAGLDVRLVGEVRELGELEDAYPRDRLLPLPVVLELLDLRITLGGDDLVTAHAAFHRGNAGRAAPPRIGMAVLAGDLHRAGVDHVAEEDGLD